MSCLGRIRRGRLGSGRKGTFCVDVAAFAEEEVD
jgi:hypothetical protein